MVLCVVLVVVVRKTIRLRLRRNVYNEETVLIKKNRPVGILTVRPSFVAAISCRVRSMSGYEGTITLRRGIAGGSGQGAVLQGRLYQAVVRYFDPPWETKWSESQTNGWCLKYKTSQVNQGRCHLSPWLRGTRERVR